MKNLILSMGLLLAGCMATESPKRDYDFAKEAAQDGILEVELGQLAQTNATSAEVRSFGQHMITDHNLINAELKAIADQKKLGLPVELSKKGQKQYDELASKSGMDFDRAYMRMMVKNHEKEVAKFKKVAESGKDLELKSFAAKTLPVLQDHLAMARERDSLINKTNGRMATGATGSISHSHAGDAVVNAVDTPPGNRNQQYQKDSTLKRPVKNAQDTPPPRKPGKQPNKPKPNRPDTTRPDSLRRR